MLAIERLEQASIVLALCSCGLHVQTDAAHADVYFFDAIVTEVQAGALPGEWEVSYPLGQPLSGRLSLDESLAPAGFTDATLTTSFFEHPAPSCGGVSVFHPALGRIDVERLVDDVHRIERSDAGSDFRMFTLARADWPNPSAFFPVEADLELADIGAPVDYLTLPAPLSPPVPDPGNLVTLRADPGPGSVCGGPQICTMVAEITSFTPADPSDNDGDGVIDWEDNCINTPNGPSGSTGFCGAQEDTDQDGYGNPCDFDLTGNGATDLGDVSITFSAAMEVLTDSPADFNCDGAVGLDDVERVFANASVTTVPGPSGLDCAGDQTPCVACW